MHAPVEKGISRSTKRSTPWGSECFLPKKKAFRVGASCCRSKTEPTTRTAPDTRSRVSVLSGALHPACRVYTRRVMTRSLELFKESHWLRTFLFSGPKHYTVQTALVSRNDITPFSSRPSLRTARVERERSLRLQRGESWECAREKFGTMFSLFPTLHPLRGRRGGKNGNSPAEEMEIGTRT